MPPIMKWAGWGGVPAPTLVSINLDFADPGGGETRIITGTNLQPSIGITTLTVGGVAATIISQTPTTLTFTVPASAVSVTDGNPTASTVTVTTNGGSGSLPGTGGAQLWYISKYRVAGTVIYSARAVTTSSGNIVSILDSANGTWTATVNASAPAYNATGGGAHGTTPYWSNVDQVRRMANTSFTGPNSTSGHWFFLFEPTNLTATSLYSLGNLSGPVQWTFQHANGSAQLDRYMGTQVAGVTGIAINAWYAVDSSFLSGAGYMSVNGGSQVTGNPGSTTSASNGIYFNGYSGGSNSVLGNMAFVAYYGPANLPTATGAANTIAYLRSQ